MEGHAVYVGDEDLNEEAIDHIRNIIEESENTVAAAGFDFEAKVIAITDQRVLIADEFEGLVLDISHDDIYSASAEGRTLAIRDSNGKLYRHRFGSEQTVHELIALVSQAGDITEDTGSTGESSEHELVHETGWAARGEKLDESVPIADRVRFWEEQDRINQELIPRVIRQHELLAAHIADHENLPLVAGNAISEALADARQEQRQLYETALEAARQELQRQYDAETEATKQRYDTALETAQQKQQQQYDAAKTAIESEARANLEQAASTLNEEWRKTRNVLVGISAAAVAIATIAIVAVILI